MLAAATTTQRDITPLQVADYRFRAHAIGCKVCSSSGMATCKHGLQLLREFNQALVLETLQERGVTL